MTGSLGKRLLSEEFEFFVADTRHFEANPDYTHRLRPRRWHSCCRAGHPLAARNSVSAAELMSYPLAVTIRPPNLRKSSSTSAAGRITSPMWNAKTAIA